MAFAHGVQTDVTLPGGWAYPQALLDGQVVRVEGNRGYHDLVERILSFRLRQLDVVDPASASPTAVADDLRAYVCAHFPAWCAKPQGEYASPSTAPATPSNARSGYQTPIDRVLRWFSSSSPKTTTFVNPTEAARRADVCETCRFNTEWENGCGPCVSSVRHYALVLKGTRRVPSEERLGACRSFGHLNAVAVWIADPTGEPEHAPPERCWRAA